MGSESGLVCTFRHETPDISVAKLTTKQQTIASLPARLMRPNKR